MTYIIYVFVLHLPCTHLRVCACHFTLQALTGHPFLHQPSRLKATLLVHVSPFHRRKEEHTSGLSFLLAHLFIYIGKWIEVQVCVTGCFRLFHFIYMQFSAQVLVLASALNLIHLKEEERRWETWTGWIRTRLTMHVQTGFGKSYFPNAALTTFKLASFEQFHMLPLKSDMSDTRSTKCSMPTWNNTNAE